MSQSLLPASGAAAGSYMAAQSSVRGLGASTSTALVAGDRRKIHTSFAEKGAEMVEEYDLHSDQLLLRKIRTKSNLGAWGAWTFEIGEPVNKFNPNNDLMLESSNNPLFVRQDTPTHFEFRIRNLPYPSDTYQLSVDDVTQEIILRTTNKKYYKRMSIPDLRIAAMGGGNGGKLDASQLSHRHANNTLVISYVKPSLIRELEARYKLEIKRMGNGGTMATPGAGGGAGASGNAGQQSRPLTTAQRLLADAKASEASSSDSSSAVAFPSNGGASSGGSQSGPRGGAGEFSGLNGLKGLAGKDGDCKQQ